jgi:hypothetical protein
MLCLSEENLGMVRVETALVISACKKQLQNIYKKRSNMRRAYCEEWLKEAEFYWCRFWRFLGYEKPVLRNALYNYYGGMSRGYHSYSFEVKITYRQSEIDCEKLLHAAQVTKNPTMWISPEGVKVCRL